MTESIDNGVFWKGISWWLVRISPFLILYLIVKLTFFAGYFSVFGSEQSQLLAHDFFIKVLLSVCAFITLLAIHKHFIKILESALYKAGNSIFYSPKHAKYVSSVLSYSLLYFIYIVIFVMVLNIWLASVFGWILEFLTGSAVTVISFVFGVFASSVLGNFIAYYVLNKVKDIKPGDRVKIDENFGDVIDIDLIFTHIRNLDNEVVSIPNIVLVTKGIKNYNKYPEVVVHFDLFLPHGTDFVKAKQAIIEGARKTKDRISDREPTIWFKQMDMWTVGCEARVPTRNVLEVGKVKSDLMESVLAELKRRRIPTGRGSEAKVKR